MNVIKSRKRPRQARIYGATENGRIAPSSGKLMGARAIQVYREEGANRLAERIRSMDAEETARLADLRNQPSMNSNLNDGWHDCDDGEMDIDDMLNGEAGIDISHEGGEFREIVDDYIRQQQTPRTDHRKRRDRTERRHRAFDTDMDGMANAYLAWYASLGGSRLANECPTPSKRPEEGVLVALVVDTYAATQVSVSLREGDNSIAAAFFRQGLVPCAPHSPTVAVTVRVLELYRVASLRCPRLAVQPFVKSLCDIHAVPFRSYLSQQFSICLDLYLSVLNTVDKRLQNAIGRDSPDWRLRHACPACTYRLVGEPKMIFSMLVTMDGNDSLKRIQKRRPTPTSEANDQLPESSELTDTRQVSGDYYLSRERVDRWAKEVVSQLLAEGYAPYVPTEAEEENYCEDRWKNMASELVDRMWGIFDETGIFLALCRHGFALVVVDMVKSGELSKYALAVVEVLLNTFGPDIGGGYDIGCKFGTTLNSSPLGRKARDLNYRALVGSFHGHAHNRKCQLSFLATYVKGLGLEDLEGCERFFSKSNGLASSVRHSSVFHRKQRIQGFLKHMDENETYQSLSTFLASNYKQAIEILNGQNAFKKQMEDQGLSDVSIFQQWLDEERTYLQSLRREPLPETLAMEYWERLVVYESSKRARVAAFDRDIWNTTSTDFDAGTRDATRDATRKAETARRHALEKEEKDLALVQGLEARLDIASRWKAGDIEWKDTERMVIRRKYQRCLDNLEGLVVSRMFELSKMNMSQTGYKMRKHIGNALKARSKAIRTALENYNAAAQSLDPPRAALSWDSIVEYAFLADFDLLADTREDIRLCPWARPAARTLRDQYFKIERAREEVVRLNVEIPRLATYMRDEEQFLLDKEMELIVDQPALAVQVQHRRLRLMNSNDIHLKKFLKLERLPGFTGSTAPGVALEPLINYTAAPRAAVVANIASQDHDAEYASEEESEDEDERQAYEVFEAAGGLREVSQSDD